MKQLYFSGALFLFSIFCFRIGASAQVPTFSYTPNSITNNSIPMGSSANLRQNLYYPSDFNAPTGLVTKIYIGAPTTAAPTYTNLTIKMGPTNLTTFTAGPFATGLTTVYVSSGSFQANSSGWIEIPLQTAYYYDNTQNLVIEVSHGGGTGGFSAPCASNSAVPSTLNRTLYGSPTASSGSLQARLMKMGFDQAPLGLKLLSFTAKAAGPVVRLSWVTADEEDMESFVLEKSGDGQYFEVLAKLPAKGNGQPETQRYDYEDKSFPQDGRSYYRLRMYELSGAYSVSPVVSIPAAGGRVMDFSVYSGTPDGAVWIRSLLSEATTADIVLTDPGGKTVWSAGLKLDKGQQNQALQGTGWLPPGLYLITIRTPSGHFSDRVFRY